MPEGSRISSRITFLYCCSMGDRSAIEWTDATWNPVTGCSHVSEGCRHCYAETLSLRMGWSTKPWTAQNAAENVMLHPARLDQPLRWRKPRRVFVNSMSDLFHEQIPESFLDAVFAVMALTPQHTFQVLTKRPEWMRAYLKAPGRAGAIAAETGSGVDGDRRWPFIRPDDLADEWPLVNVWLGVSVEDQRTADARIPILLDTPAAVRFLSVEPLLGPVDLTPYVTASADVLACPECGFRTNRFSRCPNDEAELVRDFAVDWVIVGGESGGDARPMDPAWAQSLRDQCVAAGVPFFFKQWGGRTPKAGGRLLDGRIWDEMPTQVLA